MKTFLDRFRRKGKGDEPPEGVTDLFSYAGTSGTGANLTSAVTANEPGARAKSGGMEMSPAPSPSTQTSDNHIRLELGDFLHRIPQDLLRPGPHDVSAPLLFDINEISKLIATGQTSINLAEIYQRTPDLFRAEVRADDKVEIRFPWQKLMHLVKATSDNANGVKGITPVAAEALAQKIRSRRPSRSASPAEESETPPKSVAPPTPAYREPGHEKPLLSEVPKVASSQELDWFNKGASERTGVPKATGRGAPALPAAQAPLSGGGGEKTNFNRDDLVRARDAAMLQLAETKAEFERRTEALTTEREAMADERDRAVAQLESVAAELAARTKQIEQNEEGGELRARETAGAMAQRDALQQEVSAKDAQLAALTEEIATLKNGGSETSIAALKERDAVIADLAAVRRELAEKNEQIEFHQSMGAKSAEDAAKLASEREVLQTQVAEQAAALETIKGDLRSLREGGGEKYAAIVEERDKVAADLKQARKELAEKIGQIEFQESLTGKSAEEASRLSAERESLREELSAKSASLDAIKAQLEALEKSGAEKVAAIADERDEIAASLERARQELAEKNAQIELQQSLSGRSAEDAARLHAERESLREELSAKSASLDAIKAQLDALEKSGAEKLVAIEEERDALAAHLERARQELAEKNGQIEFQQSLGGKSAEEASRLSVERESLRKELAEKAGSLDAVKARLEGLEKASAEKLAAVAEERSRMAADLETARHEIAEKIGQVEFQQGLNAKAAEDTARLVAEREALKSDVAARVAELESIRTELQEVRKGGGRKYEAIAEERDKMVADLRQARKELAEKVEQIEFQESLSGKSGEDVRRLSAELETLQKELAAKSAGFESIKAQLESVEKSSGDKLADLAVERGKIATDLDRAREELAAKIEEIELQKGLADRSAAEVADADSKRKALQKELDEKSGKLESLTAELNSLKKEGGEKLKLIVQERDSLLQFKTKLSDQLAQVTASLAEKQKAVVDVGLSKKESQRQIDELQRRIVAFESGQRATSQELNRERETRIKAERSLAAAERARQEASALIESMRTESKREVDATARKREAEFSRVQKDLQERIEALTEASRKVTAERDERILEIERVRAEAAAAIEAIKAAASAEAASSAQWESRAVAGLEEDIAKYRERIKTLLGERDAAASAAKLQIEELQRARDTAVQDLEVAAATHAKAVSAQKSTIEEITARAVAIESEKTAILGELDQVRQTLAERETQITSMQASVEASGTAAAELRVQVETLTGERDRLQSDWERITQAASAQEITIEELTARAVAIESEKTAILGEIGQVRQTLAERETRITSMQASVEASGTAAAELRARVETLTGERDRLQSDWEKIFAECEALKDEAKQQSERFAAERAELQKAGDSALAEARQQVAELQTSLDATAAERAGLQRELEVAAADLDRAKSEHERQLATLSSEHASLLASHVSASSQAAQNLEAQERLVAELRAEVAELKAGLDATTGDRAELQRQIGEAAARLDEAKAEYEKQISELRSAHTEVLSKHESESDALKQTLKENDATVTGLRREMVKLQESAAASASERVPLQKKLDAAKAEVKRTKGEYEKQLSAIRAEQDALRAAHETANRDFAEAIKTHEGTIATLKEEIQRHISLAAQDLESTRTAHENELAAARAGHDELLSKHRAAAEEFAEAGRAQERVLDAVRGELSKTNENAAEQLERASAAQEKLRQEFESEERAFNDAKKELQNRLADAEQAAAEIADRAQSLDTIVRNRENALNERDAAIARLKEEHQAALAALTHEHNAGLDSLTAEKDRQLAAQTVERAKAVASLSRERDDFSTKLAALEESLTAEIAALSSARDEAVRESTTLAQRLAAFAVESDRKLHDLKRDFDAVISERQTLVAQLDSAKEEHKAQSGIFAREFRGIVKQRDEVSSALESARSELADKSAALAREKANLEKVESEAAARLEREVTRMRRERDLLIRQRDELHTRISKAVEEQRQLLEDMSAQTARHSPLPTDVTPPSRAERQPNVIEITAAQIVQHNDPEHGINLPRVRPVPVPPPNVRIL